MRSSSARFQSATPANELAECEEVLKRFEAAWRQGQIPALDDYLRDPAGSGRALLLELVHVDLEFRLGAGEAVRVEDYLARYPHIGHDAGALGDLLQAEYHLRCRRERDLNPAEYRERFPQLGAALEEWLAGTAESTCLDGTIIGSAPAAMPWPTDLPDYRIVGELGAGGMGIVYKAVQLSLNRVVALKMIRPGTYASPELLARFHLEAEALASLQHPNIVQVYDVGQHGRCPFMSMEFLDGGSLADLLEAQRLPARVAAQLVETLARAMHCAHLRGIVHRDLKPANILLQKDEGGRMRDESDPSASSFLLPPSSLAPKVIDFGLAKRFQEQEGQTASGIIMGTAGYMAPEQAEGKARGVGPLTDVYAMGAILYEMLTGQPPFEGETPLETIGKVLHQEPAALGLRQPAVPRDLATVCLKCLEKEPARRYPSAEALADDLARCLAGEPILARRTGLVERAVKWTKRHPAQAALIGVSLAAVAALSVGGWVSYRHVHAAYVVASRERDRAAENARVAFEAVDQLYTRMADERLLDEPNKDPLREELLARAPVLYQRLAEQESEDPRVRREIALAWFRLGDVHRILDQSDRAALEFLQAIERQNALCQEYPERADYLLELAQSHNWFGELLREDNQRLPEAEPHFRQALAHQERARQLLPHDGVEQRKCRLELARSHYNLGIVAMDTGRAEQARADYDRAVGLLANLQRAAPEDANCRQDLARALINRGILHKDNNRGSEARRDYEEARDHLAILRRRFPGRNAYKFELAIVWQNLGNLLLRGSDKEAYAAQNEARVLLKELVADFSTRPRYRKKLANTLNSQGIALAKLGDRPGARQCWTEARDLLQPLTKEPSVSPDYEALVGMTLGNLGWLEAREEHWAASRPLLEASLAHLKKALSPRLKRKDYEQALRNHTQTLAETLVRLGDHAGAVEMAEALSALSPPEPRNSYYAACFIARCIPLATKDPRLGDANARAAVGRQYADRAVATLRQTPARITDGMARLANEKELLLPLEGRPGFTDALRALDARTQKP